MVKQKKETVQVRVSPEVARLANELATHRGSSTPDMLTAMLMPILRRELQKVMQERMQELKGVEA